MRFIFLSALLLLLVESAAQDIEVVYDKKRDFSKYKTFSRGESEVTTPKDQRQMDPVALQNMVWETIAEELKEKGLQKADSAADLVVSFVVGSTERSDFGQLGPLGMSPGSNAQSWSRDFNMGSLVIDLNEKGGTLVWRINATTSGTAGAQQMIDQVVGAGFKKLSLKPKKQKKK